MPETDPLALAREARVRLDRALVACRCDACGLRPCITHYGELVAAVGAALSALSALPEKGEVWWMLQASPDDAWLLRSRGEMDEGARVLVIDYPEGDSRPAGR
jgi:hypothetical protein